MAREASRAWAGARDMDSFSRQVRARMKARRLGVREVARRARLDPSFFSKILAGKRSPPSDDRMLERLALCLEMSPTALYVYAGRIPPQCQAVFESPQMLASLEQGGLTPPTTPVARPAARVASRNGSRMNAWAAAKSDTSRTVAGEASRTGRAPARPGASPASGAPPDISDDLL